MQQQQRRRPFLLRINTTGTCVPSCLGDIDPDLTISYIGTSEENMKWYKRDA